VAAATTLGANIITQVNSLLIKGSYSSAASLLTTTLQQLRASTAFKSGDPSVLSLVDQLIALQQRATTSNPATTASAAAASSANSRSQAALSSTDVQVSTNAALALGNDISGQIQILLGTGNYNSALNLIDKTLTDLRGSSGFLAGNPSVLQMVASLTALQGRVISSNPAAAASAAVASSAVTSSVASLSSSSVATSGSAAIALSNAIFTEATSLLAAGSYSSSAAKLLAAMTQIRDSSAFKAGDPAVLAAMSRLAALYEQIAQINPTAAASSAAASAAVSSNVANLSSTNIATSSNSAAALAATVQSQIDFLTSTGNSSAAGSLIQPILVSLRGSSAFLAGDPATVALVDKLTKLQVTLLANNPTATASAAAASA
jgi:hypothetical protein